MNQKGIVYVLVGIFALAFLSGGMAPSRALAQDVIKFGAFGPMTGGAANNGQSMREGIDLAVKEVNAAGGVIGKKIQIIYGDDAGRPEEAVNVVNRLISQDNVTIVLGSTSSPCSFAASQVTQRYEIPQIIISGTAARITLQGNPWIFRSTVTDIQIFSDLAEFVHQKFPKLRKFAMLHVNDDYGKGSCDAFAEAGKRYGLEVVLWEKYTRGDIDFTAQLGRIKASPAQAVLEISRYNEGALIARQMQTMGMKMPHFGADGHADPKYLELAQEAANGFYYPTQWSPVTSTDIPEAREFLKKIKATYNKDPNFNHPAAYDATILASKAIQKVGSLDRAKIRDALRTIEYKSVRGDWKFDKNGDPTFKTAIIKIVNGKEADGRKEPVDYNEFQ